MSPPTLPKVLIATWRSVRVIISLPPEQAVISYCKVLVNDELTHSLSVCLCGRRLVSACDCVCPVLRTRPFRFQATCRKRRVILPIVLCLFYVIVVCFVLHACLIWFYYVNFYLLWFSLYFGVFFVLAQIIMVLSSLTSFCWVYFFQYRAKRLTGKNVSKMTYMYFVSIRTLTHTEFNTVCLRVWSTLCVCVCVWSGSACGPAAKVFVNEERMSARLHGLHLGNNNVDWLPDLEQQQPSHQRRPAR